jgi:hypothetical protein
MNDNIPLQPYNRLTRLGSQIHRQMDALCFRAQFCIDAAILGQEATRVNRAYYWRSHIPDAVLITKPGGMQLSTRSTVPGCSNSQSSVTFTTYWNMIHACWSDNSPMWSVQLYRVFFMRYPPLDRTNGVQFLVQQQALPQWHGVPGTQSRIRQDSHIPRQFEILLPHAFYPVLNITMNSRWFSTPLSMISECMVRLVVCVKCENVR